MNGKDDLDLSVERPQSYERERISSASDVSQLAIFLILERKTWNIGLLVHDTNLTQILHLT